MTQLEVADGRIRLGGHHLDALLRVLSSPFAIDVESLGEEDARTLDRAEAELVACGVIDQQGRIAETWAGLCQPLVVPWLTVEVGVLGPAGEDAHHLWVGPATGTAAASVGDGWYDLLPLVPSGLPAAITRLGRLGLRGHLVDAVMEVSGEYFEALTVPGRDPDAAARLGEQLTAWPTAADDLRRDDWRLVMVSTEWVPGLFADADAVEEAAQTMLVLDLPSGYLVLQPGHPTTVQFLSPTDLWHNLINICRLPASADLVLAAAIRDEGNTNGQTA